MLMRPCGITFFVLKYTWINRYERLKLAGDGVGIDVPFICSTWAVEKTGLSASTVVNTD